MKGWTRRGTIGALILLVAIGIAGGSVALRASKKAGEGGGKGGVEAPALEFAAADLARVEAKPLSRWLPVSGALQPVRQATVKAKVSGDGAPDLGA